MDRGDWQAITPGIIYGYFLLLATNELTIKWPVRRHRFNSQYRGFEMKEKKGQRSQQQI